MISHPITHDNLTPEHKKVCSLHKPTSILLCEYDDQNDRKRSIFKTVIEIIAITLIFFFTFSIFFESIPETHQVINTMMYISPIIGILIGAIISKKNTCSDMEIM